MDMYGSYNEYTGNPKHGNRYCNKCGNQVPVGFKHHHGSDVPGLLKQIQELEGKLCTQEG